MRLTFLGIPFRTFTCEDCDREMTQDEWNAAIGERYLLQDDHGYRWAWYCGCRRFGAMVTLVPMERPVQSCA